MNNQIWEIGNHISEIRRQKGMTQELLAEKTGLSLSMIKKVEAGTNTFSITSFIKVLDALNVSSDYILRTSPKAERNLEIKRNLGIERNLDIEKNLDIQRFLELLKERKDNEVEFVLEVMSQILHSKDKYLK